MLIEPGKTQHYTREESEDLVSALVDHVDAQLVLASRASLLLDRQRFKACNGVTLTVIGCTSDATLCSVKKAPRRPLNVKHHSHCLTKCVCRWSCGASSAKHTGDGDRIIPDLHNLVNRVIKPHVLGEKNTAKEKRCTRCDIVPKASQVQWRGMYSARRGAITHAINVSGNIALGTTVGASRIIGNHGKA